MIVKMTILRLLGSSDDKEKEKIGGALKALQSGAPEEPTPRAPVHPTLVGRTDATMFGAGENQSHVSL